jgi:hypothetical protein
VALVLRVWPWLLLALVVLGVVGRSAWATAAAIRLAQLAFALVFVGLGSVLAGYCLALVALRLGRGRGGAGR